MKGIEISNGELYAVQQTTDKARINNNKKKEFYIFFLIVKYGHKKINIHFNLLFCTLKRRKKKKIKFFFVFIYIYVKVEYLLRIIIVKLFSDKQHYVLVHHQNIVDYYSDSMGLIFRHYYVVVWANKNH